MTRLNAPSCTPTKPPARSVRHAFTLLELMVVVLIMSIISVTVIPSINNISKIREGAARDDMIRMLEVVKSSANASGMPHGLNINLDTSIITIYAIETDGSLITKIDPLTNKPRAIDLSEQYSGVSISNFSNADQGNGSGTIWFDFESKPHARDDDGAFDSINTRSAIITMSSGAQIEIHHQSGLVEVIP